MDRQYNELIICASSFFKLSSQIKTVWTEQIMQPFHFFSFFPFIPFLFYRPFIFPSTHFLIVSFHFFSSTHFPVFPSIHFFPSTHVLFYHSCINFGLSFLIQFTILVVAGNFLFHLCPKYIL